MNARIMLKALVLPLAIWMAGCTQRTIIEEQVSSDEATDSTSETSTPGTHSQLGSDALYGHTLHILDSETGIGIAPMAGSGDR